MTELEEDDVFLRTDDCIYLQCTRTHENKEHGENYFLTFELDSIIILWGTTHVRTYYKETRSPK